MEGPDLDLPKPSMEALHNGAASPRRQWIVDRRELMSILEGHRNQIFAGLSQQLAESDVARPRFSRRERVSKARHDCVVGDASEARARVDAAAATPVEHHKSNFSQASMQTSESTRVNDEQTSVLTAVLHARDRLSVLASASDASEPEVVDNQSMLPALMRFSKRLSRRLSERIGFPSSAGTSSRVTDEIYKSGEELRKLNKEIERAYRHRRKRKTVRHKPPRMASLQRTMSDLQTGAESCHSRLAALVQHPRFDALCALMILINSVLIGVVTDYLAGNATEEPWMVTCGHLCSFFFLVELLLRIFVQGCKWFTNDERFWNYFDFLLVLTSIVDFLMGQLAVSNESGSAESLKIIKMLRICRIFRQFRFFQELSVLAVMIADSLQALTWALVMFSIVIYVFAICFTAGTTEWRRKLELAGDEDNPWIRPLQQRFGSLSRSVNSLVISMLGGVSWGEISVILENVGWLLVALFFFYIFFAMFAFLNIVTGVFVDNALQTANSQRELLVEKEWGLKQHLLSELRELFKQIDEDGSGSIGHDELVKYLKDQRTKVYFEILGIAPEDTSKLFHLMDVDGSGEVDIEEFLEGCLRLKGVAQSIDVHSCMHLSNAILNQISSLNRHLSVDMAGEDVAALPILNSSTIRVASNERPDFL